MQVKIIMALAVLLSLGLGAAHAVSPGHGKTLVAAYVLGSGGSARSALQIGLWVAVSHTAGVLVLGAVTLIASELLRVELAACEPDDRRAARAPRSPGDGAPRKDLSDPRGPRPRPRPFARSRPSA